jgi:hypothetical protein
MDDQYPQECDGADPETKAIIANTRGATVGP